jgi:short-subunit dehydrogenase involved in D-alanine esterification of teichoic acids
MHTKTFTLLLLALLSVSAPALAVYKCEAAGKVVYSDAPCRNVIGGSMKEIDVAPPLSDTASAQQRAEQNRKELHRLETARKKQEAIDEKERRHAFKTQEAKKKKCRELALRAKWAREDAAQAAGKSSEKARRNAHRAAEKYHLACGAHS